MTQQELRGRRRRRAAGATAVLGAAALVATALPALADTTATQITGTNYPSTFTLISGDYVQALVGLPGLELTGSYTGTPTNSLDTVCYQSDDQQPQKIGTAQLSGSSFRAVGRAPLGGLCRLRAVPASSSSPTYPTTTTDSALASHYPARLAGFPAALTEPAGFNSGTVNSGLPVTSVLALPQLGGTTTGGQAIGGFSGGVSTSPTGADGTGGGTAWGGSDYVSSGDDGTGRAGLQVDGVNALSLADLAQLWGNDPDQPSFPGRLVLGAATDAATGDTVATTSEPVLRCSTPATLPITKASCAGVTDTGVTLTRTVTTSRGGRITRVTDSWSSAAGHALSLEYEHALANEGSGPRYGLADAASATSHTDADTLSLLPAPGTVYGRTSTADPALATPAGSVSYSQNPTSARYADTGATLVFRYDRQLPAGRDVTLTHTFVTSDSSAEVSQLSQVARTQALAPSVALDAVPSSTFTHRLALTGTVTAGQNGRPATVTGPGGTTAAVDPTTGRFSLPVALQPGTQNLVVMAVDQAGGVGSATATTAWLDPLQRGRAVAGFTTKKVKRTVVVRGARRTTVTTVRTGAQASEQVRCLATAGCRASFVLRDSRNRVIGSATKQLRPGLTTVTVPLTRAAYAAAVKAHSGKRPTAYPVVLTTLSLDAVDSTPLPPATTARLRV